MNMEIPKEVEITQKLILSLQDTKPRDILILSQIAFSIYKNVRLTQDLLVFTTGYSKSTINRSLKSLEEKGYISRITKYINKKRTTLFTIKWDKIKQNSMYEYYFTIDNTPTIREYINNFN